MATSVEELSPHIRGEVFQRGEPGYDEARRIWNGTIEKEPAVIVRARGVADVIDALALARARGLRVSVKGGGHHVAGGALNDGGLVIDLSQMRSVRVDANARTVRVEGGATLGDIDRETQAFGLVVPMGVVSETGIGGLTLAGGVGWIRRKYGYAADNLVSADVVTADGRLVHASPTEEPELFWAVRGGGWHLGVVTSFEFRAYPLGPEVPILLAFFPAEQARQVLEGVRKLAPDEDEGISPVVVFGTIPHAEAYPQEAWGKQFAAVAGPYAGAAEKAEAVFARYKALGEPFMDLSGVWPWLDIQKLFDEDYPKGMRYYWKSSYLKDLTDGAIDTLITFAAKRPSSLSTVDVWMLGGALAREPAGGSPIAHRDARYLIGIESNWEGPAGDMANKEWTRSLAKALEAHSTGGSYLNFEDVTEGGVYEASRGPNQARLSALKQRLDPQGLFA